MDTTTKIIKPKLGLLNLAKELGNISTACRTLGYSRDSYYRFKSLYESGGSEALREISRKKPILANRVSSAIEEAVVNMAISEPAWGQLRVSHELKKVGILISPGGVRSVWLRHKLNSFKLRLKALEVKMAKENGILTESQLSALEKGKAHQEAHGEIESEHPGYLGAQDTYYVGTIKGVGKIYQQTFIDTYTRVSHAKLYTEKTALTAADCLNDQVIPFFEQEQVTLLRVLTDRGSEYCGKVENHAYQLYLNIEDIDHTRTKAHSPQTNGICERFHRTLKEEFYDRAFRKKIYTKLDELQQDLDSWLDYYNHRRPHSGKYCYGKTPMQTWNESKKIATEKSNQRCFYLKNKNNQNITDK